MARRKVALSPGEADDVRLAGMLLSSEIRSMLLADRGSDADWTRQHVMREPTSHVVAVQLE